MFKMGDSDGVIQESYTYQNTNSNSNKIANYLINNCKINKEDKVGIFMLNCAEFVFSILAIHKTGAIQVPINGNCSGNGTGNGNGNGGNINGGNSSSNQWQWQWWRSQW